MTATYDVGRSRILTVLEGTRQEDFPNRWFLATGHSDAEDVKADDRMPKAGEAGCRAVEVANISGLVWVLLAKYDAGIA
jgi:hypothetical protein